MVELCAAAPSVGASAGPMVSKAPWAPCRHLSLPQPAKKIPGATGLRVNPLAYARFAARRVGDSKVDRRVNSRDTSAALTLRGHSAHRNPSADPGRDELGRQGGEEPGAPPLLVSVVVCAWTAHRWGPLRDAVRSLREQTPAPADFIVVVDHNDDLLARVRGDLPDVVAIANAEQRGLSGGRNTGVRQATGDIVAFLDDDARASPGWLAAIVDACREGRVMGVGGPVIPRWERAAPGWLPEEFLWVVGCSFRGQPDRVAAIRNPIGANMAFRREVFRRVGMFTHALARTAGSRFVSCDETEFSIRMRQRIPDAEIVLAPGMRVEHLVPAERTTWRYFRTRCFGEGFAKALVSESVGSGDGLASERYYVLGVLQAGVARGLLDALRGDPAGVRRAGAIVAGLAITIAGYLRARLAGVASHAGARFPGRRRRRGAGP
jgi:GT2 family glycosyltransferase